MRLVLLILLAFFSLFRFEETQASAVSVEKLEKRKKGLMKEIAATEKKTDQVHQTALQLLANLNTLTEQLNVRRKHIKALDNEIKVFDEKIGKQEIELLKNEKSLKEKQLSYTKAIRQIYFKSRHEEKWLFLLSSQSFSQFYNRVRYLKEYSYWREQQGIEIRKNQQKIKIEKEKLYRSKKEKEKALAARKKENEKLDKEERQQKLLLRAVQKQEKELRKELAEKQRQAEKLDKSIEEAIREEAEERLKSRKEASGSSGNENNSLLTQDEQSLSSNFASNRGKLPIPIRGTKYRIVGHFGIQHHEQLKNIVTNNSGIDLQTDEGAEARCVFNGVVSKIFFIPGSGGSIIIRHGNYLSVYSNLSQVFVRVGEKVETRKSIGLIAPHPSYGNRTVLHFQVWKETTKLNPEIWLDL